MDLLPFTYRRTWDESLHIFLFTKLILNKKKQEDVHIEHYHDYKLTDTDVKAYNAWLKEDGGESLLQWMEQYADQTSAFNEGFNKIYQPKVELWSDRLKTGYFEEKLQSSQIFENYIEKLFKEQYDLDLKPYLTAQGQYYQGENELGIEIKNDTLIKKWGNIYLEYAEKSNAFNSSYVDSGIMKEDQTKYFLIGDYDGFWVFRKARLVEIYREEIALNRAAKSSPRGIQFKVKDTSLGMTYPVKYAESEAISLDTLVAEIRENLGGKA